MSKRIFDLVLTSIGLMLVLPFLGAISVWIWITQGRPILFRQLRPGYKGELFTIYKFRTMANWHDENGNLLSDEARITRLGRFLRSYSLDELPETFNILKGEMSLVGPRPLLTQYLERYNATQARRHNVMPGITGWAQINGRNVLTWQKKFELDVWYVDHWSFWLDLKILFMTFWKVIRREGISPPGKIIAEEFMGNEKVAGDEAGDTMVLSGENSVSSAQHANTTNDQ